MIMRYEILFLIISFVFSDDHIPRQTEIDAKNETSIVNNQAKEKSVAEEENDDWFGYEKTMPAEIVEPHRQSVIQSVSKIPDGVLQPNAGAAFYRDLSYVTFTALVAKSKEDCYFYKARKNFDIDFQVLKGGDLEIAVNVYDITSKQVSFHNPARDGTLKVMVPADMVNTDYSICLDNKRGSWHEKKVFVMVDVEGPNGENHPDLQSGDYANIQKHMTKLDLINTALTNVYSSLMKIEHHQDRRRLVEAVDRSIMESNYEYVTFWAIVQICMMVLVAAIQLVMIRSLFDSGSGARLWRKLSVWTGGWL